MMSESVTLAAIEAVARTSYGRLIAYLAARAGDVAVAEDALGDAFVAALERWPVDGIPRKPEAWLLHAARNRTIDAARHNQVRQNSEKFLQQVAEKAQTVAATHDHFPDERLNLLFGLLRALRASFSPLPLNKFRLSLTCRYNRRVNDILQA
jgi:predicted RNA polymerase sigma factor